MTTYNQRELDAADWDRVKAAQAAVSAKRAEKRESEERSRRGVA